MHIDEQLNYGNDIFKSISDAVSLEDYKLANSIIQNTQPPKEWVKEYKSLIKEGDTYKTIKIELLEAIAKKIYGYWGIDKIDKPIIISDKSGKVCITVKASLIIRHLDGINHIFYEGLASEVASSIALMPLVAGKVIASCKKACFKQIGDLFGRSLSRGFDEGELPEMQIENESPDRKLSRLISLISDCQTEDELKSYKIIAATNELTKKQYELKLKQIKP